MTKLDEFLRVETSQFLHYQSAETVKYHWRVLVFSCNQEELKRVALSELQQGLVIECKISRIPWKTSSLFNSTFFFPTLGEALQFRSRQYENPNNSVAGPIPLKLIESRYLEQEQGQRALTQLMEDLRGTPLSVDLPGNQGPRKS